MNHDWLKDIIQKENQCHLNFFGREFDLSEFEATLLRHGEDKIKECSGLLLEPHFLPKIEISRKSDFPGFKVRPTNHHYEVVYQGKVLRIIDGKLQKDLKAHWLLGQTVLIDTRLKPAYQDGVQIWLKDNLLGPIIQKLREEGNLPSYMVLMIDSRFGVSDLDFDQMKMALAERLNVQAVRLERAVDGVVIPQLYPDMPRKDDGATDTSVWYEEFFEDRADRVGGGDSDCGGLADVVWGCSGGRWNGRSFRPLAVL